MKNKIPSRIARLPKDAKGRPIPWFVWIDDNGTPDFRVIGPGKIVEAHTQNKCWVCGDKMGRFKAFVIGPMCAVNRTTAEPPSHLDCARFSVAACPFLSAPKMHRNEKDLPSDHVKPAGEMIARNPGVALIWVTQSYKIFPDGRGNFLFDIGEPSLVEWYREGRVATRAEVMDSIDSGLPLLRKIAEEESVDAVSELGKLYESALRYAPSS